MKLLGFLMLLAGWVIVFAAALMLESRAPRVAFVLAGIGVEILGFGLFARSHMMTRGYRR